jgi:hypothetical protein
MSTCSRRQFLAGAASAAGLRLAGSAVPAAAGTRASRALGFGPGPRSRLPWHSGVYQQYDEVAKWRGRPLDVVQGFGCGSNWNDIEIIGSVRCGLLSQIAQRPELIAASVPLCPPKDCPRDGGPTWWRNAAVAGSDVQKHWIKVAQNLKNRYPQNMVVRLGWEMNHKSFPWYVGTCTTPEHRQWYKDAWKSMVELFRKHYSASARFDWCIVHESSFTWCSIADFYPGDDWVDVIGIDCYDWWPPNWTPAEWDHNCVNNAKRIGIQTWMQFATSHGKAMSVPEWGLINQTAPKPRAKAAIIRFSSKASTNSSCGTPRTWRTSATSTPRARV